MTTKAVKQKGLLGVLRRDVYISRLLAIMILWMAFMAIFKFKSFYSLINFQTMAAQFPEFGLMALGIMLCMITGGIDLSVVGVANFASIITGITLKSMVDANGNLPVYGIPVAISAGLVIGALAGTFNGFLVAKVKIPPILATLGTFELFSGIAIVLTKGKAISGFPEAYSATISGRLFGFVPMQLIIFAIMTAVIAFLMAKTTYGKKLYMLGTNMNAAYFSGLKTDRLLIKTYLLSGISAALAGVVMLGNYNSARADYGTVYTLQCVLIVVLGGISPTGGKGRIGGVVLAIAVLQMLSSGLNRFPQISSFYIPLIWGGVLIAVMVLNYFTENKKIKLPKTKPTKPTKPNGTTESTKST
jgi:simple sugar transport system permease protein